MAQPQRTTYPRTNPTRTWKLTRRGRLTALVTGLAASIMAATFPALTAHADEIQPTRTTPASDAATLLPAAPTAGDIAAAISFKTASGMIYPAQFQAPQTDPKIDAELAARAQRRASRLVAEQTRVKSVLAAASALKDTKPFPRGANSNANNRRSEWLRSNRVVKLNTPRAYAVLSLDKYGWGLGQWQCLDRLWWHESGWSHSSGHTGSAYGIPQSLPGSKMASAGKDWRTNPETQIDWGLKYIDSRYGSPCRAFNAWGKHAAQGAGWY